MNSDSQAARQSIEALLESHIGLNGESLGTTGLAKTVAQVMNAAGFTDPAAYLHHLETLPQALTALIEAVVVPETSFFRHPESFAYLRNYVSAAMVARPQRRWRVLSLPCSTGEEPYSIAIALLEAGLPADAFQIDGIDISARVLAKAKQGCFEHYSFRKTATYSPERHMRRYFQMSEGRYCLDEGVRSRVQFHQGNLVDPLCLKDQPPYDIVFCRNLLIYLHREARDQAIETLDRLLVPNGLLFVGYADTSPIDLQRFVPVAVPHTFAYRKLAKQPVWPVSRSVVSRSVALSQLPPLAVNPAPLVATDPVEGLPDLLEIRALADGGQLELALKKCDRYLQACPTSAAAYLLLGEVYRAKDDSAQAESAFQKALYLNPNCVESLTHLTLLCEQKGEPAAARRLRQRLKHLAARLAL